MIGEILSLLDPRRIFKKKKAIKLEIIASQVAEFKEAKKEIDTKINHLEEKTHHMEDALNETLDLTTSNQQRLQSIEENMEKIVTLTRELVRKTQGEDKIPDDNTLEPEPTTQ